MRPLLKNLGGNQVETCGNASPKPPHARVTFGDEVPKGDKFERYAPDLLHPPPPVLVGPGRSQNKTKRHYGTADLSFVLTFEDVVLIWVRSSVYRDLSSKHGSIFRDLGRGSERKCHAVLCLVASCGSSWHCFVFHVA